ncbi:hypothetical protein AVEN_28635-1 [Araneus ventricosus]|uniref:Uncharacterized protein n=1 Tax=Araneus ventricosus TaxID=182803 RepID=A0A4Y2FHK4_ARAVE|nr:hypothetical protein AVEN_28635-1 [Araneus ventricosus]
MVWSLVYQAVTDCGRSELYFEDFCQELSALEAWKLYAIKHYTLNLHSLAKITVSGSQVNKDLNIVVEGNKNHEIGMNEYQTPDIMHLSIKEPTGSHRPKDASLVKKFAKCSIKVSSSHPEVPGHHPLCL